MSAPTYNDAALAWEGHIGGPSAEKELTFLRFVTTWPGAWKLVAKSREPLSTALQLVPPQLRELAASAWREVPVEAILKAAGAGRTRVCRVCRKPKSITEFRTDQGKLRAECRACEQGRHKRGQDSAKCKHEYQPLDPSESRIVGAASACIHCGHCIQGEQA